MEQHVKVLAVLYLVFGALGLIGALISLMVFGSITGLVGLAAQEDPDALLAIPIVSGIGLFVFLTTLAMSLPGVIAGFGLLKIRPWSRVLTIVLSILNLFFFPIGTALGIYGLWVLFSKDIEAVFAAAS